MLLSLVIWRFLNLSIFQREVHNETVVLPSQDQLVQIVISELHSKHSIDLHPASGITPAVSLLFKDYNCEKYVTKCGVVVQIFENAG